MHVQVQTNAVEGAGNEKDTTLTDRIVSVGFGLIDAARLYTRRFAECSRNLTLDPTQCRVLIVLAQNEGITQHRLAELTALDAAKLGRVLDGLERRKLVKRHPRVGDRRAWSLEITPQTSALLPLIWGALTQSELETLEGLSQNEALILIKALERVHENLQLSPKAAE